MLDNTARYIYEIYREKSVSQAAKKLFISQAALSSSLKKAEEELVFYEEKLGLAARFTAAQKSAEELVSLTRELDLSNDVKEKIVSLLEAINSK